MEKATTDAETQTIDARKTLLRRLLIEDLAGHKIRKAMEGHEKKKKASAEEEDENDE